MNDKKIVIIALFALTLQVLFSQFLFSQKLVCKEKIEVNKILEVIKFLLLKDNYFVLSDNSIHSFDKKGKFIKSFSNRGNGPGEFYKISGFTITDENMLIIGGYRTVVTGKISIFELSGKHVKDHMIDFPIKNIFYTDNKIFYSTNDTILSKLKKKSDRFETLTHDLFKIDGTTPIISFLDNSQINPPHISGKHYPFPWFPGPYPNKIFFILDESGQFHFFQSKEIYFIRLQDSKPVKIKYKFVLKDIKITDIDKQRFFEQIESVNERKLPKRTKDNVVFPEIKDYFKNVFLWNKNFALITESEFLLISHDGELLSRFKIPAEIFEYEEDDIAFAADRIGVSGNYLYYMNVEGMIFKYEIIKK